MAIQKLIAVKEFCLHHQVNADFVIQLNDLDMIKLVWEKRTPYIPEQYLQQLEKMLRLHLELEINLEGIQTIIHLLNNLEQKEAELQQLRNSLSFYLQN